jgi:Protein involved in formate dehydrogenase formation
MWTTRRQRAEVLRERYPFAAEVLTVYIGLVDVWEDAWELARDDRPQPRQLVPWTAERVLPRVVKATEATGPEPLAAAARERYETGGLDGSLATWLAGGELPPVERYLARASLWAPLVALQAGADAAGMAGAGAGATAAGAGATGAGAGAACADDPSPRGGRRCPCCGGPPQLSFRGDAEDRLVSGRRYLACARCGHTWSYSSSACPSCGETTGSKRTVYAERRDTPVVGRDDEDDAATFPHLRVDACASCQRYVIDVDLGRDPRAVPDVDELAALPLDLYATEQGLSKITPNLMGF